MIRFLDGPAQGVALCLRRAAPLVLRVVLDETCTWDALDQLTDTPGPGETIYAYRRVGQDGRRIGEWFKTGDYQLVDPQPTLDVLQDTLLWRAWVTAQQRGEADRDPT